MACPRTIHDHRCKAACRHPDVIAERRRVVEHLYLSGKAWRPTPTSGAGSARRRLKAPVRLRRDQAEAILRRVRKLIKGPLPQHVLLGGLDHGHLVIHQHVHRERLFHECHRSWALPLKLRAVGRLVVSRIITGSDSRIDYGSDDPEIVCRVDRLRRRIEGGICFAGGPITLASSGQRRKQHPESRSLYLLVEEIERDLLDSTVRWRACSIRFREVYENSKTSPVEWVISGTDTRPCLWERITDTHLPEVEAMDRNGTLEVIARELAIVSRPFERIATSERPLRRLAQILGSRSGVGGGSRRFAYLSPRSLARALAEEVVSCSGRTIRRRTPPLPRHQTAT